MNTIYYYAVRLMSVLNKMPAEWVEVQLENPIESLEDIERLEATITQRFNPTFTVGSLILLRISSREAFEGITTDEALLRVKKAIELEAPQPNGAD